MKKEKIFFNLINQDVPEKDWEAKYLVQKDKDFANYVASLLAMLVALVISMMLVLTLVVTTQCSGSIEFEGKGDIVLNQADLPSTLDKFEFTEGKVKLEGTLPCSFLTQFPKYGGN